MKAYLDRLTERKMNKGGKFLNKLWRCIGWGGGWRVLLYRRGVLYDNLILSTWGDYVTVHRKEIYQLTYRALALRQSKWNDSLRRRVNTWNFSFRNFLRWAIYIINAVDKTKLSWQKEWQTGRRKIERTDRKDWRIHVSQADTGCCVPEFGAKWAL